MDRVSLKVLGPEYLSKTGSQEEAQEGGAKTSGFSSDPQALPQATVRVRTLFPALGSTSSHQEYTLRRKSSNRLPSC